jgi:hypothetical protein
MKTHILVSFEHRKPIPDVTDLIAGRIYMIDQVEKNGECMARILTADQVRLLDGDLGEVPAILKRQAA